MCVCVCGVSFCGGRAVSSSPPAGCGVGSCCTSSGVAAVPFPGAPAVFCSVSCSWLPFSGSAPIWLQLAGLLLQWTFIVGLAVSWYTTWFSTLCQHCLPLAGSATFLAPVCWSPPAVEPCCWVGGVFVVSLGFLPCAVLFLRGPAACTAYPTAGSLGDFQVTGCLSFCFPGDVGWASALPYFFVLLLLRLACRGLLGSAPCVKVLQLGWCLLFGRQCCHPAGFPLP